MLNTCLKSTYVCFILALRLHASNITSRASTLHLQDVFFKRIFVLKFVSKVDGGTRHIPAVRTAVSDLGLLSNRDAIFIGARVSQFCRHLVRTTLRVCLSKFNVGYHGVSATTFLDCFSIKASCHHSMNKSIHYTRDQCVLSVG